MVLLSKPAASRCVCRAALAALALDRGVVVARWHATAAMGFLPELSPAGKCSPGSLLARCSALLCGLAHLRSTKIDRQSLMPTLWSVWDAVIGTVATDPAIGFMSLVAPLASVRESA